jgi:hypothetical protein
MRAEDKIIFAGKLLELIRELEVLVIDYCRLITADEDGHWLENDADEKVPF